MKAWIRRYGVHGSALPGLRTSGIFKATAGTHSECTPGELLGSTTPSASARGVKLTACPPASPRPWSRTPMSRPRVSPSSTAGIARSTPATFWMRRRTRTWGRPVVADTCAT